MAGPGRRTNLGLLALLVIALGTGVAAFGVGEPEPARWVVVVHGAAGLGVLLLAPWKSVIVRRGLRRSATHRAIAGVGWGIGLAVMIVLVLSSGVLHAVGGFRGYLGLLPMQLHVGGAVGVLVLLAAHLLRHRARWRPRTADLSRRTAFRAAALVAGSAVLYAVVPGATRRETGSHQVGTDRPSAMPVTQWALDPVPVLSATCWRMRVDGGGAVGSRAFGVTELAGLPQRTVRAVLDCTGGWYAEQDWRGVPLAALLPGEVARVRSIDVVSATGYRRRFPARDLPGLLLATHAAGLALSAGHGGPARLVAPGRRGFWWVKWVVRIELVDEPWWWQPPFPPP